MRLLSTLNEDFKYVPLNELYFGKKPLEKLKEKFDVLYTWCKANRNILPYKEKFYIDFNKEVAKTFGMTNFRLMLEGMEYASACTYAVNVDALSIRNNTHFYAVNSELGIKFVNMYNFRSVVIFNKGVFTLLTADEAFAILLHEIGHSFEAVIRFGAAQVGKSLMELSVDAAPVYEGDYTNAETIDDLTAFVDSMLKSDNRFVKACLAYSDKTAESNKKVRDVVMSLNSIYTTITGVFKAFGAGIKFMFGNSRGNDGKFINSKSRGNEYFCDSFAVMYGYGKEINSVNLTLNSTTDDSFICAYYDFIDLPRVILNATSHPTAMSRSKASIAHLRFELKNNKFLTPEEKKNIENDIKAMEATVAKYLDDSNPTMYDRVSRIGNKAVEILFGDKISKDLNKADYDFGIKLK